MKITIFGGGGFIGSTIADRLLEEGHDLRIFERPRVEPYRKFSGADKIEWITGDFSSTHDVSAAIEGVDAVMHLVSTTLPKNSNDDPVYDVQSNIVATLQMLNAMAAQGVSKIIFISSGGTVYGNPQYLPIDEKHPADPLVSYGITKLTIEKYLQIFERAHGIRAISLRVANPYGERQRIETAQGAVGVFLHHALKGIPIEIWGDGSVTRDYIHISDVAEAFVKALEYQGEKRIIHISDVAEAFVKALEYQGEKRIFNISSGTGTSLTELVAMLEGVLGKPVECRYLQARPFDVRASVLSNALAREELKWAPKTSMPEGLKRTAEWMLGKLSQ